MRVAVYSCITGVIDSLKTEQRWGEADWFLFTDQPFAGGNWQIRPVKEMFTNPRRNARLVKTTSHRLFPDYDYSIWIDGSMQLLHSPEWLIDTYMGNNDLAALTHPDRDCVFEEAKMCKLLEKDDPEVIDRQMTRYKENGLFPNSGLAETKVVIRKNTGRIASFNDMWTLEILNNSLRDQLSFNYCALKNMLPVKYLESWKTSGDIKYYHHDKTTNR